MKTLDSSILAGFIGSEEFVRYSALFRKSILTDGAMYVAETAGAFWLMDVIGSHQTNPLVKAEGFQVWKLVPNKTGDGATAICEDGNKKTVVSQRIPFTDFPFIDGEEFVLWAIFDGQYLTIMLPSEY